MLCPFFSFFFFNVGEGIWLIVYSDVAALLIRYDAH